ncbi:methyltransferase domain-containing protein [Actinoplanes sp. NEAU-A12]|uniref:Methyltransferase domain-containing protein n=1 Tax=Actinoplanes sandaracinus TaxID=3045177 RepID=A0ABT6WY15_9ACTN|nr:methyltransferase domain-containing protein [Actinoplanes sandaracinus]MDI6104624.1 methyltransferase domain-containing protein [Actinoplanes sandaracinus]
MARPAPHIELNARTDEAIDGRHLRAVAFTSVRMRYVQELLARLGVAPAGKQALVIGSVRGDLARGLATLGPRVTAADPSPVATGRARDRDIGGGVRYETSDVDDLGRLGGPFDLVYCADTLEISDDLDRVISAASAVVAPGGVLFYDTVARTPLSRIVYLGLFQGLPATRIMPPGRYAAPRLRPPEEVIDALHRHGLTSEDVRGFKPGNPVDLVKAVFARRSGRICDDDVAPMVNFVLEKPGTRPLVTYLGCARRA